MKLYNLYKNKTKHKTGYNTKGVIWPPNVTLYKP